ncbi:MAG TPA: hypothetical protein VGK59_01395 [Ohtaekwangia sp.]
MFVPFNSLPGSARVWIYQSDRVITFEEEKILSDRLKAFCQQWMVHGEPMDTSFEIRYNRFVILAANDQASGCSIDSSVRILKEGGAAITTDFFNRNLVAFLTGDGVKLIALSALKNAYASGEWNESTMTFNNLIDTKASLETGWLVEAQSSWLKRYLPHQPVVR